MEDFLGSIITLLVLAFLIVFLSGEVKPRNQTVTVWFMTAAAIPVGLLLLTGLIGLIL